MNERQDGSTDDGQHAGEVERRLAIPKQLLTISSSLTTALLAATVAVYTFWPSTATDNLLLVLAARDRIVEGLLIVSFLFFVATVFSLSWYWYENIPPGQCLQMWGFSWRTSVPGSLVMLIFSTAVCALLAVIPVVILLGIELPARSWGPFVVGQLQYVRVTISVSFLVLFWLSIQEIIEPFLGKRRSVAGMVYVLLWFVACAAAFLRPWAAWAASLGLALLLFLAALSRGWWRIARQKSVGSSFDSGPRAKDHPEARGFPSNAGHGSPAAHPVDEKPHETGRDSTAKGERDNHDSGRSRGANKLR